jgi:hypothetical protein
MEDKATTSAKVLSASVGNNEASVMDDEAVLERWMTESRRFCRPGGKVVVFASPFVSSRRAVVLTRGRGLPVSKKGAFWASSPARG